LAAIRLVRLAEEGGQGVYLLVELGILELQIVESSEDRVKSLLGGHLV
jgi:hypothetical protein